MSSGSWREVFADDGNVLERGQRTAVCDKTFQLHSREPYAPDIISVEPLETVPLEDTEAFDCSRSTTRHPRESKGMDYDVTDTPGAECYAPGGDCC